MIRSLLLPLLLAALGCAQPAPPIDARLLELRAAGERLVATDRGVVVAATTAASEIGARVLAGGGNAVDAAIATGFALAVTYPTAGNIGGGGFMVIRFPDGSATAIDFREKAPLAAHAEMFVDSSGEYSSELHHNSHLAVGVPGTVAGFAEAHARHGRLQWPVLVEPSVRLARAGFALPEGVAASLENVLPRLARYPASLAAYSKRGQPYRAGERFRQPDLARTLDRIRRQGRDGFYQGETARLIAAEMRRGGGLITVDDLARYEPRIREPVRGTFRGVEVISMPPPSSGGVALIEMLNVLEGFDLEAMGHNSASYIHHLAEAMRRAYRDRAEFLADPDFVDVPVERLTSKAYAARLRATIDPTAASISVPSDIAPDHESLETTHYSVVDEDGMAVAVTYTLEAGYGSKIVVPGAGFLLNNEMGDFNARPGLTTERGLIGTRPNLARPEQRMLSSMTPTILARDGRLLAVVGSPGGRTIINTVLQITLNLVEFGMPLDQAISAARLHHQWLPDRLTIEQGGSDDAGVAALRGLGHEVRVGGRQGRVHAIALDPPTGQRVGMADPRDPDAAAATPAGTR